MDAEAVRGASGVMGVTRGAAEDGEARDAGAAKGRAVESPGERGATIVVRAWEPHRETHSAEKYLYR
jgi:hypothetical protein